MKIVHKSLMHPSGFEPALIRENAMVKLNTRLNCFFKVIKKYKIYSAKEFVNLSRNLKENFL